jgi:radical SAM enzyme (TIGR01210 family)
MPSTNDPADRWDSARIVALRPPKNAVDPLRPYAFLVEPERTRAGAVEDTAVIFLTNRECPFRCLMCDLWKNTTDRRVPDGAIAGQVEYALARLPPARHVKLYNAGNFLDPQAIPPGDWPRLAELLNPFQTVIVESHPRLIGPRCLAFRDLLRPKLEVAMGLETVHPEVLPRLNKRMTTADFEEAAQFLTANGIGMRAFVLLRPPFLDEAEGVHWAKESIRFAFDAGAECCAVIPTRAGNGAMEELARQGHFAPPRLESLEEVLDYGLGLRRGRVFADLWDVERFYPCERCGPARAARLRTMNLTQQPAPPVVCPCGGGR